VTADIHHPRLKISFTDSIGSHLMGMDFDDWVVTSSDRILEPFPASFESCPGFSEN